MPLLNRQRIRDWLEDHNWSIQRLADECLVIDPEDRIPEGTMRNAVNGIDQMRNGRIRLIAKVTAKFGDPIPLKELIAGDDEEQDGPKKESTGPKRRENGGGSGTGPKKAADGFVAA